MARHDGAERSHGRVIIGAGMSGLCQAVEFSKAKLNFVVLEKADSLGGTCTRARSSATRAGAPPTPGNPKSSPTCAGWPSDVGYCRTSASAPM
ncbi:NAD(P)-binding protein [Streptomyces sp. NEAU-YJ-81]|nr:NAD(P)-binding protein [Streptomyces sp. NEAU-YJ-81]